MANPITDRMKIGTLGELFVQLRLLEFNVQAAPPLKDSGNDLIAIKRNVFKTIQVKTTTQTIRAPRELPKHFDLVALVKIEADDCCIHWDNSKIYLISKTELGVSNSLPEHLDCFELTEHRVSELFEE